MTVYVVVQLEITNRESYDHYQSKFWDVFRCYNGELLVSDESPELLEGEWRKDKIVIISFPDQTSFNDWASSPEYLEIAEYRKAGAKADIILTHGFSLDDSPTFKI